MYQAKVGNIFIKILFKGVLIFCQIVVVFGSLRNFISKGTVRGRVNVEFTIIRSMEVSPPEKVGK